MKKSIIVFTALSLSLLVPLSISSPVEAGFFDFMKPKAPKSDGGEKQDRSKKRPITLIFHNPNSRVSDIKLSYWKNGSVVDKTFIIQGWQKRFSYPIGSDKESMEVIVRSRVKSNSKDRTWSGWSSQRWRVNLGRNHMDIW